MQSAELTIIQDFHIIEKDVLGFEDGVNCDDVHYLETLEKLAKLVKRV